jgi:hypothetical protein
MVSWADFRVWRLEGYIQGLGLSGLLFEFGGFSWVVFKVWGI